MNRRTVHCAALLLVLGTTSTPSTSRTPRTFSTPPPRSLSDTFPLWSDHPAIAYNTTPTHDPIAGLKQKLADGRVHLSKDGTAGYLRSLLDALDVPVASQMIVFVPDSVQGSRINRNNPRALYFNDTVAVGWVRGGFIELAAQDPRQGVVFYSLEESFFGTPRLAERRDCLNCHYSYSTVAVPGMLVRSSGQFAVDHRLSLDKRWGGWFVTGRSGSIPHLGNTDLARVSNLPHPSSDYNWPSLEGRFDATGYLAPQSDIAALMVFEHQMHMMNLLTRIGWQVRVAAYDKQNPAASSPVPLPDAVREAVDYMLFVDEAPIAERIVGSTNFAEQFSSRGPRDRRGRSLRQLDLTRRLMAYPCSYMIYSEQFDALPTLARDAIYQRMWQVLSGRDPDPRYRRLSPQDRQAIVEILRETKKDLPSYLR